MAATAEKTGEKDKTDPILEQLSKKQQRFARRAAKAMAKAYGVNREDFELFISNESDRPVVKEPEPEDLNEDGTPKDGTPWVEAASGFAARYAIRYAGEDDLENFNPDAEQQVMVRRKLKKGREGWAFPVHSTIPDDGEQPVPTVDIPKDI